MRLPRLPLLTVLAIGLFAGPGRAAEPAANDKINKKIENVPLAGADGKAVALHDLAGKKATVVLFLSFDCPVSNSYAPTLAALHKEFADKGVSFVAINSSDDLDAKALADKAAEFKLPFVLLKDEKFKAADAFKAEVAPEAFVLDPNRHLRYRGRIDNAYSARLKKNTQTTEHDLQQALNDLLGDRDVKTPVTRAVGCPIQRERVVKAGGKVTYHRDVLPILQRHCQTCHRPGEVGPFALMTYKQAVNWADDVKEYTHNRKMPPWKPIDGPAFHNERRLTDKELQTLAAWVADGTPEGDPRDAPKPREFIDGWQLGKPDLILTVPDDVTVGASGKDMFRCFALPTGLKEDKYVIGYEVRPGNKRVVHHSLNFFDTSGQARALQKKEQERAKKEGEQDRGPGYAVAMGVGFIPNRAGKFGGLGGWAPGQMPRYLPEGTGYLLPKDSDVVLQLHYHRTGREEKDRTSIGLYFAKKPVKQRLEALVIPGRFLWIPAGEEKYTVKGAIDVLQDCTIHSVMHHMHMLGREATITVTPPQGKPYTLLAIKDWDYNWQETYWLKEPIFVKEGTRMTVEATYDNSAKNPNNPFSPPRLVVFGEQTDNEMCFVFLTATADKPGRIKFLPEGLAPPRRTEDRPADEKK